ncbi:phosphoethanolamine transferase [Salinivibrio costicola]|uniref:Phosphoethanolamine transferase n=2 Tax=Salinivibrio TaxID=51366 RepID=A0ABX3KUM4_SALCS|nr:phosphoethanolamine--lipid A transferase [Salinivibrio costicola]OOF35180.1 phosphoethanolamine transferase [Salinivibrio costicola subsp. alcaliphilus]
MKIKNLRFSYTSITIVIAVYFALIINVPIYSELGGILYRLDSVNPGFVATIPLFFIASFNIIFNAFSWPLITKPFFIILLLLSSAASYATFSYGVIFDSDMIVNVIETDSAEASSYISIYSLAWFLFMGGIPSLFLFIVKIEESDPLLFMTMKKSISVIASIVVILIIATLYYQDYASVGRNNSYLKKVIIPTELVYSIGKYVNNEYLSDPLPYKKIGEDAQKTDTHKTKKPTLFVFVLGETARAQNQQLNGYSRKTNQFTSQEGVISFKNVSSCGTATAVSVPCLFSILERENFNRERADKQDNLLDIMQRAGTEMLWVENDSGDKNVAKHIPQITVNRHESQTYCDGQTCFDEAVIQSFIEKTSNADSSQDLMTVLHLIGSHGPTYFKRYPENMRVFTPDCQRADIENCSKEEIVNTYDNTILYTDYVINKVIKELKDLSSKYNTALIYVSDHGESLGENGIYLHGLPYSIAPDFQTHVPMFFWADDNFLKDKKVDSFCLNKIAERNTFSHDNIFHSLLGIMDISTSAYQESKDIFSLCRQ